MRMPATCLPVGSDSFGFSQLVSTGYALPANRNNPRRHAQYTLPSNLIQPIE
jgi:hypothetical protein